MASENKLDLKTVLDGLGQGVLVFGSDDRLIMHNLAAGSILGANLNIVRTQGWNAISSLFNARRATADELVDSIRQQALQSSKPVRFKVYLSGEYIPCWAAAVQADDGEMCTMITLDVPDWGAITMLVDKFRDEMQEAVESTQGHIDLINQTIKVSKEPGAENLAKRIQGFTRLVSVHMHRVGRLIEMLKRMEEIRIGKIRDSVRAGRRKINLADFMEDFVEELDEIMLVDPETEARDHRSRLKVTIPDNLVIAAAPSYITRILHDVLRNAIMYSMVGTPVKIEAQVKNQNVQINVVDEGYGIREKELERVFEPYQRARQPQIISEFGYGLSLYLCKNEVEAMNGRMWFESQEGVGTTFSFMLPLWQDEASVPASSSSDT